MRFLWLGGLTERRMCAALAVCSAVGIWTEMPVHMMRTVTAMECRLSYAWRRRVCVGRMPTMRCGICFFGFSMKYRFCSSWAVADIWFDCSITIECGRGMDYDEMIFYWWFLGPFYQRFKDEQRRSRVNYWCRSRTNKYDVKCTSTRVLLMSMEVNEPSLS